MKKLKTTYLSSILLLTALSLHAQVAVDKSSLSFSGQVGGPITQQTVTVTNPAGSANSIFFIATIPQSVTWLRFAGTTAGTLAADNTTGNTPTALNLVADPTGLVAGSYSTSLSISPSPFNNATVLTIPVTFTVSALGVNPTALQFSYQNGGTVQQGQSLTLTGPNTSFTAAASTSNGGNWLQVAPTSGAITGGAGAVTAILDPIVLPTLAAGTYNGTITVTPTGSGNNTPVSAAVTLTVTVPPPVTVSASSLQLNYQIGGSNNQAQQVLTLSTTSSQALNFGLSAAANNNPSGRNWILISPSSGVIPANGSTQVTVSYDTTANLPAGTWGGTLTLFTPGAAPAQQNISVNLLVSTQPLLSVPSAGMNFSYELNSGVTPAAQTVVASSTNVAPGATTGQMVVNAAAATTSGGAWLSVTPASGTTGTASPFTVSVNPSGLNPGKYQGTVTFTGTGAGNGAQTVPVTLNVANDPSLLTNLASLTFADQIGQSAVATAQTQQTITLNSSTGATLNYVASVATTPPGQSWIVLSGNTSASTNNSFTVSVFPAGLAAGTYTATITVTATNPLTGNPAINSPITIPVTLYVSNSPLLVATLPGNPPAQPTFTAQVNGSSPLAQSVTLQSSDPTVPLTYSATTSTSNGPWLFVAPQSGTTSPGNNVLNIGALPGILSPGTYTGTVTITAQGPGGATVADSPYVIPVTFQVTSGALTLSQTTLSFSQTAGSPAPPTQTVQVGTTGSVPLNYTAVATTSSSVAWLSVSPATGNSSSSGLLTITADGSKLSPGTYTGTVTVTSPNAANSPATVSVTLTVAAGTLAATPASLTFTQVANGSAPPSQTINVTGTPNSLNFTATAATTTGGSWLTASVVSPGGSGTGATPGQVQVSANAGTLAVGQYTGSVTVASSGANGSPIAIPVTLNVVAAQTLTVSPTTPLSFSYIIGASAPTGQTLQLTSTGASTFTAAAKTTDGANWLSVSPTSGNVGTTATALVISVNPTSLAAGNYTGTVTISSPSATNPVVVNVNLTVTAIPTPTIAGIINAASGAQGKVSPGENITIFGSGIGPASQVTLQLVAGKVSTNLGNTQVLFDGIPAPVIYATATQTSVMVPYEIAGRATTNITVTYQGVPSIPFSTPVVAAVPGIYSQNLSGTGPGAILNQDGITVNGPKNPAPAGSVVAIYMTGEGVTQPASVTGGIAPNTLAGLNNPLLPVTATVGGVPATVLYAGSAPGYIYGLMQVNIQIPAGLTGIQPLVISVGGTPTQTGITVQVQ